MAEITQIGYWLHKGINFKMGVIAGILTGSVIYYINYQYGYVVAFQAFVKQFLFNFCMAGFTSSLCERMAKIIKKTWLALILASLVPTAIAFVGVFSVHYFLHTPNPIGSTLWQAYSNAIIFFITGLAYHKELEKKYRWVRLLISSKKRIERRFYDTDEQ